MASTSINASSTAYTLLTSTDALIQNTSSYVVRVVFAAALPAANVDDYHELQPFQAIQKLNGLPSDNAYGMCSSSGNTAKIIVSS